MKRSDPGKLPCPCGLPSRYSQCCAPFHERRAWPENAERLMRSRYSAYAMGADDWILASWHADTRPAALDAHENAGTRWTGLTILEHVSLGPDRARVHFRARFRHFGRAGEMSEQSLFARVDGRWYYVGQTLTPADEPD